MEDSDKTFSEQAKPDMSVPMQPYRFPFVYVVVFLLLSILSGIASGWWFARKNTYEVLVVDVKKIVEDKKKELIERYKKDPTDETAQVIDKELTEFLKRLDYKISNSGDSHRLIMLKEAVLSGETADITEEVKKFANQQ